MKVGVLFSGGKDSNYSLFLAKKMNYEIKCLIFIYTQNDASYMFQKTSLKIIKQQAKALNLPFIYIKTKGEKEKELIKLDLIIKKAIREFKIEGVVSGAIKSNYQFKRIKKICEKYKIKSITPIWQINEEKYLNCLML
jgi:diphthine-ammonia ligase